MEYVEGKRDVLDEFKFCGSFCCTMTPMKCGSGYLIL